MNLDRNIVIEASAGTGKTYTLVQTILQALFQKNLPMESVVALTFTRKAAGEMKERIAAELQKIDSAKSMEENWRVWGLSLDTLQMRAREALERIDLASIGTIHSFAYSLLKRFPLLVGISPDAEVDEKGVRGDDLFEIEWPKWLRVQLSDQWAVDSEQRKAWLEVLERLPLSAVRDLARRLCDFDIPLEALPLSDETVKQEVAAFHEEVRRLRVEKPDGVNATRIAKACEEILGAYSNCHSPRPVAGNPSTKRMDPLLTSAGDDSMTPEALAALDETPGKTKEWLEPDVKRLKVIIAIAKNLVAQGDRTLALLTHLLKPFIERFRERILAEGHLSNNALLVLARDLVANERQVRETLKRQIRILFIDEFQDTDPLQGELLLYLAEVPGASARRWDEVKLEHGKLFIVGDPKQSIYLFRGADISAYGRITQLVLDQGGVRHLLEESYRSHDQIIHAVNSAFAPLIQEKAPISPAYQALIPRRKSADAERHRVELRLAYSKAPKSSAESLATEAADAALWIASNVQRATSDVEPRTSDGLHYKDIALIFRSTTAMSPFVEELRARNIPFVVEGERYFYRTPEVTDALNLIRALADRNDRIALAGFLRSPLGGFTDAELSLLQRKNGLQMDQPLPKELRGAGHQGAWDLLQRLKQRVGREPLKNILRHLYEDTFLMELAARSYHRDQTLANLAKLRRLMESFAEEGETTLAGLLLKIDRFMEEDRMEGESPLADETYDAVRLLTIHKAKGLEYPVVWLPGLHRHTGVPPDPKKVKARFDWASGRLGIKVGKKARNMGDFILESEFSEREDAEDARVLYVAMTRARDHLILSGGVNSASKPRQPASGSFLAQLAGAWKIDLETLSEGELRLGEGHITVRKSAPTPEASSPELHPANSWLASLNPQEIAIKWKEREKAYEEGIATKVVLTPSTLNSDKWYVVSGKKEEDLPLTTDHLPPAMLGTLVHKFLESWDFQSEKCAMPAALRAVANSFLAGEANPTERIALVEEAQRLLADFIGSEDWEEIKGATLLGREVPFFYEASDKWYVVSGKQGEETRSNSALPSTYHLPLTTPLMRGTIDILYRLPSGQLVVGDYKTDQDLDPEKYKAQAAAYTQAVSLALNERVQFKLISIRQTEATSRKR